MNSIAPVSGDLPQVIEETISSEDFLKFREFFYRKTGIHFDDGKRYFVDKRLLDRVRMTGHRSFRDYFITLRFESSGKEMQQLVNLMTVNETYFFREEYQFQCMVNSILPEICQHKRKGERLRIWSIPSSSGEEPYSIALYLLEFWKDIDNYDVEILASDIDTTILEQARKGRYSRRSVQNLPPAIRDRYFKKVNNVEFQANDELRSSVEFSHVNLSDPASVRNYRHFDLIFCRNLLIYFDDNSRRMAAETFFDALNPGGFICLGHSESMSRISGIFKVRKFDDAMVYQRPL